MLRAEGVSAPETDDKLIPETHACYASGNYTFMDIRITGAATYAMDGGSGNYRVEPSRNIVFESGPLKTLLWNDVQLPEEVMRRCTTCPERGKILRVAGM